MTVTPASEIPLQNYKLPPGFKAEVWATRMPGVRAMVRAENGEIYIGTRAIGRVYELTDDGSASSSACVKPAARLASTLKGPRGRGAP